MTSNQFINLLLTSFERFPIEKHIGNWKFEGKTNIAYGTKGGAWNPQEYPGYLFVRANDGKKFILRPVNSPNQEIIAIESVHNTGQLINYRLNTPKNYTDKNGITTVFESFNMTVGSGRVTTQIAKAALLHNGLNQNGIVLTFNDQNINVDDIISKLLDWAIIRENAKNEIRQNQRNVININETIDNSMNSISIKHPTNQILYGPPGTGKTYNTIEKVVEICEPVKYIKGNRSSNKKVYDELLKEGRVYFTTFHQSMSYEDFLEGIKPNAPEKENEQVIYKVEDGIFKQLCIEASFSIATDVKTKQTETVLDFSLAYDQLVEEIEGKFNEGLEFELDSKNGGKVLVDSISQNRNIIIKHHGGERTYTVSKQRLSRIHSAIPDIYAINNIHDEFRSIIGGSNSSAYWSVLNAIQNRLNNITPEKKTDHKYTYDEKKDVIQAINSEDFRNNKGKPFVLIIDEINRGNVSAIFGELITLIEEDKRLGHNNEITVTLPYSKEKFGVPSNLYIIGTMNTADRSVEALDTALRRRFSFVEMLPQPKLLTPSAMLSRLMWKYKTIEWEDSPYLEKETALKELFGIPDGPEWNGRKDTWSTFMKDQDESTLTHLDALNPLVTLNLEILLETINSRIEVLVDRDHTIGHAYLMDVESLADLKSAFKNKIIPLLQEYFYGDYRKMEMVIGPKFFNQDKKKQKIEFAIKHSDIDIETDVYEFLDIEDPSFDMKTALESLLNKKQPNVDSSETNN